MSFDCIKYKLQIALLLCSLFVAGGCRWTTHTDDQVLASDYAVAENWLNLPNNPIQATLFDFAFYYYNMRANAALRAILFQ